jgi:hypothetical protein
MKFLKKFLLLWVIFALLDPDSESGTGFTDLIESGSNPDPDPKHWNTDKHYVTLHLGGADRRSRNRRDPTLL